MREKDTYKIKVSKIFWTILGIIFLIWLFWPYDSQIKPDPSEEEIVIPEDEEIIPISNDSQIKPNYYDTWYWPNLPINYYFTVEDTSHEDCDNRRKSRVIEAFKIIEEKTNYTLKFIQSDSFFINKESIKVLCSSLRETEEAAAEGWFYPYSESKEISEGGIILYRPDYTYFYNNCDYPDTEIHEILHAFGFDHIGGKKSILSPMDGKTCTLLDNEIADCLVYIYSENKAGHTCEGIPFIQPDSDL